MDVHLRDLRYFVAVAEELSFSRAAERLYVSQPTVSKQVRALERSLQVTLFHRAGRSVELTEAGAALLETGRGLVSDWERAQEQVSEAAARAQATIVVGIHTGVARGLAGRVAELLSGAALRFRQVGWEDPTAGLADGATDAAIVWLPLPGEGLSAEILLAEPRIVLLASRHRLAGKEELVLDDLADEPFFSLPGSAGPLRDFWLGRDAGLEPRVAGEVRNADETFEAVAAGAGLALASEGNARNYAHEGVVARPVAGLAPSQLAVAWRSNDARPLVADFVAACVRAAQDIRAAS